MKGLSRKIAEMRRRQNATIEDLVARYFIFRPVVVCFAQEPGRVRVDLCDGRSFEVKTEFVVNQ